MKINRTNPSPELRNEISSLWFAPLFILCAFILVSLALFWLIQTSTNTTKKKQLVDNAESIAEIIHARLNGNQNYLQLLLVDRRDGRLDAQSFQERGSRYVIDHPELINITWVDSDFVIHDVAPLAPNKQILGLRLELPEPKRVSRLAKDLRQPVYSQPFEAIQGNPSFELWMPVFRDSVFLGLFGAVYSCERTARDLIPAKHLENSHVSLVDSSGTIIWQLPAGKSLDKELVHQIPLTDPANGLLLRFAGHGPGWLETIILLLEGACLAFVIGLAYSMWRLRRDSNDHKHKEEALRKERNFTKNITETSPVGITRVDRNGIILFANRQAEQILGLSKSALEGLVYDDPAFRITDLHGNEYPNEKLPFVQVRTHLKPVSGIQYAVVWPDGKQTVLSINAVPLLDEHGQFDGMVASLEEITERKQAEQQIADALNYSQTILEAAPFGIITYKESGETISANQSAAEITGATIEQLQAQNFRELKSWQESGLLNAASEALCSGEERSIEIRGVSSFGKQLWLSARFVPFIHQGRKELLSVFSDISGRRQAEEELRFFGEIMAHMVEAVYLVRMVDGVIAYANPNFEKMFGYDPGEMEGKHLSIVNDPATHDPRQRATDIMDTLHKTGFWQGEVQNIKKDGTPFWTYARVTVFHHSKYGRVLVSIQTDITERKRAEEELRRSEKKYRLLSENTSDGVSLFEDNRIQYVSEGYLKMLGYTKENMEHLSLSDIYSLVHKDDARRVQDIIETAHAHQTRIFQYSFRVKMDGGGYLWVEDKINAEYDLEGRHVRSIIHSRDITDRKLAEETLRNAQKLESIGTLAGGIAHDFNNLLNAMLGQSSLAIGKLPKESPARNHIEKSIKAAERAADLTRQLLAYSGKGKFITEEIDLSRLVSENVQMLETSVPKSTQIQFEFDSPSPRMMADMGQIQQVIMNLIINSGEAMGSNPGCITVHTGCIDLTQKDTEFWKYTGTTLTPRKYALLRVSDDGCGMSQETLNRIFDPFFTTKFAGRGLGLAAVLGIIRGHHGGIRVRSEEGRGTTFDVIFPFVDVSTTSIVPEEVLSLAADGEGRTVLLIDDEPAVLELLTDIFADAKYTVISASNPMEGIGLYRQHQEQISVVILDYSMPGMDGKAAFEELIKINNKVNVLLCSGYTEEEMMAAFGTVRPVGFLHKPYKPAEVLERVSRMLSE